MFRTTYTSHNGNQFDILGTIELLLRRPPSRACDECLQELRRMAFTPYVPTFLLDLDSTEPNLLVLLDMWFHTFGVAVVGDDGSGLDDSSLTTVSFVEEFEEMQEEDDDVQSWNDVITEAYASYDRHDINPEVIASFMNMRYGWQTGPESRHEEEVQEEEMQEEE